MSEYYEWVEFPSGDWYLYDIPQGQSRMPICLICKRGKYSDRDLESRFCIDHNMGVYLNLPKGIKSMAKAKRVMLELIKEHRKSE